MLVLALVVALGLIGTVLAAVALRHAEQDRRARALSQQTGMVGQVVTGEMRRYSTSLSDLAAAIGAQSRLEAPEFTAITAPVDRQRLPGASGVGFVVPTPADRVAETQAYWRARGVPVTLRPSPAALGSHRFLVLSHSIDGTEPPLGLDLAASVEATEAMRIAEESHGVATSRTYRLLKDASLPPEQRQLSFVLAAPVYSTSPDAADTGQLRGWVTMGLRGRDFLHEAIGAAAKDTVAVTLSDVTSGDPLPVASWEPRVPMDNAVGSRQVPVAVPQRSWALTVQATRRLLAGDDDLHLEAGAWVTGIVITALLAALTATVIGSRDRALRRVDAATSALRTDIARREEVEQQLRRREAELVGFAGIVAHDLRSPLARVLGYADFLRDEAADRLDPEHRVFLDRLHGGAQRMQALIDDLLDYATADNRRIARVPVDLQRLAGEVAREQAGDGEVTVTRLPVVEGDPTMLRQVLDNLIGNAIKYTAPGVRPMVRVGCRPDGNDQWRIDVTDNGIGIPEEDRANVFTAFARARGSEDYPGTGLGLAIVARIVERHHGRTGVEAAPGGGSVLWFTLPAMAAIAPDGDDDGGAEAAEAARVAQPMQPSSP
ncbi:hypothetical protein Asp14428_23370 [Actinoplanes sp. NBRC 14428]|uniref:Sensor-like histidine kinase SenX3 n=1 Tax=Pseudosporangium ferrugineum TaxID=439699 RepID=A0A2T0S917_9ACTN|nr:phospho-acceptor domain-containing protein [Pseudosporangium ferrugineum]BCJ50862.1 hypothetical protein Asp14428_23370 [Actinoplanes sp. NBRC 14428]